MTVAWLLSVIIVAGLGLAVVHQRERNREAERLRREIIRRTGIARSHEYQVPYWTELIPSQNNWRLIHRAAVLGPSNTFDESGGVSPKEDLYVMGDPPYDSGLSYRDLGEIDRERAKDVMKKMAAFHEAMAEKWKRAAQSPGTPVEPDPPPPVRNIASGTNLIW